MEKVFLKVVLESHVAAGWIDENVIVLLIQQNSFEYFIPITFRNYTSFSIKCFCPISKMSSSSSELSKQYQISMKMQMRTIKMKTKIRTTKQQIWHFEQQLQQQLSSMESYLLIASLLLRLLLLSFAWFCIIFGFAFDCIVSFFLWFWSVLIFPNWILFDWGCN